MTTSLTDLDAACIDHILYWLAKTHDFRCPLAVCRDASNLTQTSRSMMPLGVRAFEKLSDFSLSPASQFVPPPVRNLPAKGPESSTAKELAEVLKEWGVATFGRSSKEQMWDLIRAEVHRTRPSRYWCPLSHVARDAIQQRGWVPLSVVSKEYLLRPAEREGIRMKYDAPYPYGTKVWDLVEIHRRCLQKFGSADAFRRELTKRQSRREGAAARKDAQIEARRERLERALEARGCVLRDDSRLCDAYIERGEGDLVDIAITMEEMQFYFAHTRYNACFEEVKEEELEWNGRYHVDEVSHDAKQRALEQWVRRQGGKEQALSRPELPASLRSRVSSMRRL